MITRGFRKRLPTLLLLLLPPLLHLGPMSVLILPLYLELVYLRLKSVLILQLYLELVYLRLMSVLILPLYLELVYLRLMSVHIQLLYQRQKSAGAEVTKSKKSSNDNSRYPPGMGSCTAGQQRLLQHRKS